MSAFMRWYSCAAPELSALFPALIQILQMKCNLYTRWETEQLRANVHTEETERHHRENHRVQTTHFFSGNIFINMKLAYLFSNHLGLLINFLPIGHITQEVMALRSWERDLFCCFFEALFRSAPQDHLAKNNISFKGWKQTEKCSAFETVPRSEGNQVNRCL